MEDDVMDVVASTQPQMLPFIPSSAALKPVAQRLLRGVNPQYRLHSDNLIALVCLISSLKLSKSTWGAGLHYGSLEEYSPQKEELVNILLRPFCLDHEGFITPKSMLQGLDFLMESNLL
ncbi:hypothetical protein N7495_000407 [Penicillium taxi]|uniref:uncharacterized protein n=1 Tax=Penicillium taxi TaxID=168475 RepID=UPI002545839A|nr:uncharacterized protein N7495_000407 [Penicillium taxi]KAJ5907725.1 hypothetical protein N7495_000407 [Penicillium taxi]